jgi:polysaccharide export outer membrane protein
MMHRQKGFEALHASLAAVILGTAVGCAAGPARVQKPVMSDGIPTMMTATAPTATSPAGPAPNSVPLQDLASQRHAERNDGDYVVGEGDVLTVKAYDLDELNQKVRVDGDGAITLPLLNSVPVAGRTVAEVQKDLTTRLGQFMYDPHISVFVEEYRSQQVSVQGAVQKPGMVNQMVRSSTVRDALAAAGGMNGQAGSRIYLVPARHQKDDARAADGGAARVTTDGAVLDNAIMVDTHEMDPETQRQFFDLPVRGGDVIVVPNQGRFIAEGWVSKPGIYPLNPGLTLRGAIAVAGGLSFPAKAGHIQVLSPGANGETQMRDVDYTAIASLKAPDMFLRDGDVVHVTYTTVKVVPWGFYRVISDLLHLAIGTKITP